MKKITIFGNPFIGIYIRTTDKFTFIGKTLADNFERHLFELNTSIKRITLADSDLIGTYAIANNKGIIVSSMVTKEEIENLQTFVGSGVVVERLESKFTAVGNNIVTNDYGTIINPRLPPEDIKHIKDALDKEVEKVKHLDYLTVGATIIATNKGFVAHPNINPDQLQEISEILKVDGGVSTVNEGVPFVSLGAVANGTSFIVGETTTGYEIHRIAECLGQI